MSYLLYFSPDSANLVIRMALEELQLDYTDQEVVRRRTGRDAEFFRLNPRGLLPVLIDQDNGNALFETGAILLYLADRHQALVPSLEQTIERGECLSWLFMLSNTLHADLRMQFYTRRFVEKEDDMPMLQSVMQKRILEHLKLLDDAMAKHDGDWLLSSGFSICDFYLGCCVRWAQLYPDSRGIASEAIQSLEYLSKQLNALERLDSVQRALSREEIINPAFIKPKKRLPPPQDE